jgi:TetR/AcrR family transcriptional regulator, transcriptional repressor for nem operon
MAVTRAPEKAATGESPRPSLSPRGLRSRAAIVDAAATMMRRSGVASTSLDDVLAAAGCGKSQLYHYFDDRADLIRAVIDRQVELILAAQPAIHHADSWAGLRRWSEQVVASHRVIDGPFACPLGSMAAELKNDPAYLPHLDAAFRRWEEPLARGLGVMRDRGQLTRQSDPDRMAQSLVAAVQGGLMMAQIHDDGTVFEDAVENALLSLRRRAVPRRRTVAANS